MFTAIQRRIDSKIAQREQKQNDERIVVAADKLPASEINELMVAIGLKQFATFR